MSNYVSQVFVTGSKEAVHRMLEEAIADISTKTVIREDGAKERKLVLETLSNHYDKIVMREDADRFPGKLDKYIIVGKLASDSPVDNEEDIPKLKKYLLEQA